MSEHRTRAISTQRPSGFPIDVPFIEHLGLRMVEYTEQTAVIVLDVQPWMRNSWEVAHGGIVMTMLDVAMAMAGRPLSNITLASETSSDESSTNESASDDSKIEQTKVGNVTVEMKTTFIAPARGVLTAKGLCLKRATSLAFCEAELFDESNLLIAKSSGTFKFWRGR
jgi:acyl-coenzyme A thioesterase PaaI-like protein